MNPIQVVMHTRLILTRGMLACILGIAGPVIGQPLVGGTLQTQFYQGASLQSGACTTSSSGAGFGFVSGLCDAPGGYGGVVSAVATFQAPTAYDPSNPLAYKLASLGAAATSGMHFYSEAGPVRAPTNSLSYLQVAAVASYSDYLQLGANRPTSLSLSFELSGALAVVPPPYNPSGYEARVSYSVGAQSGNLYPGAGGNPASFGSFDNFGYGAVTSQFVSWSGITPPPPPSVILDSRVAGEFSHATNVLSPELRLVTVTLGAQFFSNPDNGGILLRLGLFSQVLTPTVEFAPLAYGQSGTASAVSAFDSTFKMVGLTAYDDLGNDITGEAIVGFASLQPVPEPGAAMMLLVGLGMMGGIAMRRRMKAPRAQQAA